MQVEVFCIRKGFVFVTAYTVGVVSESRDTGDPTSPPSISANIYTGPPIPTRYSNNAQEQPVCDPAKDKYPLPMPAKPVSTNNDRSGMVQLYHIDSTGPSNPNDRSVAPSARPSRKWYIPTTAVVAVVVQTHIPALAIASSHSFIHRAATPHQPFPPPHPPGVQNRTHSLIPTLTRICIPTH